MKTERVDDIPLLIAEFEKSKLSELIKEYFPDHGNWRGVNGGTVAVSFLTYILSCSDHRISHVETWGLERLETLRHCLNSPNLTSKDLTDDKLGALLDRFSDESRWSSFEHAHNQRLINVYDLQLKNEAIRLDAFITQSHREAKDDFQYGYSKHHRSDLPQLKTMVATLDPFSMPLYSVTVSGNTSDDGLYLPVITELIDQLPMTEQLFVGDSKMGSFGNRKQIHLNKHYYLMPLNRKQCTKSELSLYLADKPADLVTIVDNSVGDVPQIKAQAFEKIVRLSDVSGESNEEISWEERRILVYSPTYAKRLKVVFKEKIAKALDALALILVPQKGRKKLKTRTAVALKIDSILKKYQVQNFVDVQINEQVQQVEVRGHLNRPARTETILHFSLDCKANEIKVKQHLEEMGWQIYACNAPKESLSTEQAILCYRNEYKIEHKFDELLNRITALMPVYLQKPKRIKALIRLLLLALKYVSLIQFTVRKALETTKQKIKELYAGNPTRATNQPTTNMMLRAFRNITLVIVPIGEKNFVKISDLKPHQLKILELLNIPPEVYSGFNKLSFSHYDFSET